MDGLYTFDFPPPPEVGAASSTSPLAGETTMNYVPIRHSHLRQLAILKNVLFRTCASLLNDKLGGLILNTRRQKREGERIVAMSVTPDEVSVDCFLLEANFKRGEACAVTLSLKRNVILLEGITCSLRCHPIDEIDALLIATIASCQGDRFHHSHPPSTMQVLLLRTVEGEADVIVALDGGVEAAENVTRAVDCMRQNRLQKAGSINKFVKYMYPLGALQDRLAVFFTDTGASCVKWSRGETSPFPSYPHSRLDFLRLHVNRSVMCKLSSNGDTAIELSCDGVAAAGHAVQSQNGLMPCHEFRRLPLRALSQLARAECLTGFVLIISNQALYLTKSTGSLVCRVPFESIRSPRTIELLDDEGSTLGLRPFAASRFVVAIDVGENDWMMLVTKYAHDVVQRLRASSLPASDVASGKPEHCRLECSSPRDVTAAFESRSAQTDVVTSDTRTSPQSFATNVLLEGRNKTLSNSCDEKDVVIRLLQRRLDILLESTAKSSNKRDNVNVVARSKANLEQENDVLRHYVSVLEQILGDKEIGEKNRDQDIQAMIGNGDDDAVAVLQRALREQLQREELLERKVQRLTSELAEVTKTTEKALSEIGQKATTAVQDFVLSYEKKNISHDLPAKVLELVSSSLSTIGIQPDTTQNKHLRELNAQLVEELKSREIQLDELATQLGQQGVLDQLGWHMNALFKRKDELLSEVSDLSAQAAALHELLPSLATKLCNSVADDATQRQALVQQVNFLHRLNGLGVQLHRVTALEGMVLQAVTQRKDFHSAEIRCKEVEKELHSLRINYSAAQQQIRKLKSSVTRQVATEVPKPLAPNAAGSVSMPLDSRVAKPAKFHTRQDLPTLLQLSDRKSPRPPRSAAPPAAVENVVAVSPPPRLTDARKEVFQSPDDRSSSYDRSPSIAVQLSGEKLDETQALQRELEAQRLAFEQRLRDLEMVAFHSASHDQVRATAERSMGVVPLAAVQPAVTNDSRSPGQEIARLQAENILLRAVSSSPSRRLVEFKRSRKLSMPRSARL